MTITVNLLALETVFQHLRTAALVYVFLVNLHPLSLTEFTREFDTVIQSSSRSLIILLKYFSKVF